MKVDLENFVTEASNYFGVRVGDEIDRDKALDILLEAIRRIIERSKQK